MCLYYGRLPSAFMARHSVTTKFLVADRWCCNQHVPPKPSSQNRKSLWHGVGMANFDVKFLFWILVSVLARSALRWVNVSLNNLKPNSWSDSRTTLCCLYYSPLVHWDLTFHFNALSLYDLLRNHGLIAHEPFFSSHFVMTTALYTIFTTISSSAISLSFFISTKSCYIVNL
jgi:hypothetical protein